MRDEQAPPICAHLRPGLGICHSCLLALSAARRAAKQTAFAIEAAQVRAETLAFEDRLGAGLVNRGGLLTRFGHKGTHAPLVVKGPWLDALGHPQGVRELNFEREG